MIKKHSSKLHGSAVSTSALRSVFEELKASKKCAVSKYILGLENIPVDIRHYFMCDIFSSLSFKCIDNEVLLSFIPKDKFDAASTGSESRQIAKPAKVANTLINDKRPSEKVVTVQVTDQVAGPLGKMIPKNKRFWLDEEEGIAYNDSENVFEIVDDEILATAKSCNKQYSILKKDDFENFANYIKNNFLCNFEFKILRGKDIAKYYNQEHYFCGKGKKGTLWGSCMRDVPKSRFDYYVENPESIGLLAVMYEGKLLGRALLWTDCEGKYIMDRIYSYEDYIQQAFIDYAIEHKITYKTNYTSAGQYLSWKVWDEKEGKHVEDSKHCIEILLRHPHTMFREPAYLDTFVFTTGEKYECLDNRAIVTNYYHRIESASSTGCSDYKTNRKMPKVYEMAAVKL